MEKKKIRNIILICLGLSLVVDLAVLLIVLINKETQDKQEQTAQKNQYAEQVDIFYDDLLTKANHFIDDSLNQTDPTYDMDKIISFTTSTSNNVIFTTANENYLCSIYLQLEDFSSIEDDIKQGKYTTGNITIYTLDNKRCELLNDATFKNNLDSVPVLSYGYLINDGPRSLSLSYFCTCGNYISISDYSYQIGSLKFSDISEENKASYNKDKEPILYYLIEKIISN